MVSVPSGGYVLLRLLSNSIAAGSWDRHDLAPSNVSWSTNTFDYPGSITSATWNGSTVAYNRGGTGQSSAFVAGGIVYGSSTTALAVTAIGTTGQALLSNGASAPTWGNPTSGAGGSTTQVQYNSSGALAGSANMTFDGTTLTLANDALIHTLTVGLGLGSVATNTAVGYQALNSNTIGSVSSAVGYQAFYSNTQGNGTAIGYQAAYSQTTGGNNTAIGYRTLYSNLVGQANTAIGDFALNSNTGSTNSAQGNYALYKNTSGFENVGFGNYSGYNNLTGNYNVFLGIYAGYNSLLSNNVFIGDQTAYFQTGSNNTAIGQGSFQGSTTPANNTGTKNVNIGVGSLNASTSGSNNVAVGYQAGSTITSGINNLLLGYQAAPSAITVSNEITIGNSSNTVIRYPHSYSTVASLPSASTVGRGSRTFVTDGLAPVFQATVAGGGAVFTPVYSDGTNWKVG